MRVPPSRCTDDRFVGIDLGTSGCRAVVIDRAGDVIAEAREPLPDSLRPAAGHSEQDPADWWRATATVLHGIDDRQRARVRALAVDGTSSSLLLCDTQGIPRTPALMYDDTRSTRQADLIARHAPDESPAAGAGSALAKLLYLYGQDHCSGVAHALHQADWVAGKLAGRFGSSDENNCLKLGYDPVSRRWPVWIERLGVPMTLLPRVVPIGSPTGTLSAPIADEFGFPHDARIVAGTTDSNAASVAAGIQSVGEAVTSLGSTLVLKILSDRPVSASRFGVYSHRIGDRWLVGGASNSGGLVLRQLFTDLELHELSARIDPAKPSGLDYYPLPTVGERFPVRDEHLEPRLHPRPKDRVAFLHGILEGIARIEAEGYGRLADLGAPYPTAVFSSGGGATNETWRQIRQRLIGVPVLQAEHGEAAYGSALLARSACTPT